MFYKLSAIFLKYIEKIERFLPRETYFPRAKVFLLAHQGELTHPFVYTNHSGRVWRRQDKEALLHALTSRPFPLYSRAIRCETIRRLINAERARPDKARWTWCAPSSINCFEDTRRSRERFANSEKRRMDRLYAPHILTYMVAIVLRLFIIRGTNVSFPAHLLSLWSSRKFDRRNHKKVLP